MRVRDQQKRLAICEAAIQSINALGFEGTSIAKIASAAAVSPATIYIYFENKEDLVNQVYLETKRFMVHYVFHDLPVHLTLKARFSQIWHNQYRFMVEHGDKFRFVEQFHNSPLISRLSREESRDACAPLWNLLEQGKVTGQTKNVPNDILVAYAFAPIVHLTKQHLLGNLQLGEADIQAAFELAWDAISR